MPPGSVSSQFPPLSAATVPFHASQMYAANVAAFVANLTEDGALRLDLEDEIIRDTLVTHEGRIASARVQSQIEASAG